MQEEGQQPGRGSPVLSGVVTCLRVEVFEPRTPTTCPQNFL